jgi:F-type H+-transporting ATPase subunit epsilon
MGKTINLQIISQEKKILDTQVDQVSLPAVDGEMTVLPHHASVFAQLQTGNLKYLENGKSISVVISQGFANVSHSNNQVKVLVDSATHERDLSVQAAKKAMEKAKQALEHTQDRREMLLIEAQMKKAAWELRIAQQTSKSNI